jgi:hypothetical protein
MSSEETKMTLTHRRTNDELSDGWVVLFCDSDRNQGYGDCVWTLGTELPRVTDQLVEWAAEYYEVDEDEARSLVDPEDIVDTAGAWDDSQFVSELWQAMEGGEVEMAAGYRTEDGAVVLDRDGVEMTFCK